MQIRLAYSITDEQRAAVLKYLVDRQGMSEQEWLQTLKAFDLLAESVVIREGQKLTFAQIYRGQVEEQYADFFIEQLLQMQQVEVEGTRLKAVIARQISQRLAEQRLYRRDVEASKYLLAYCYYWWDSFARGYLFEARIFKDLEMANISFLPHDLRRRSERFSRSDLVVMGYEGDIKTSTYFLHTTRTRLLRNDFYITRIYDTFQREHILVVMLKEAFWNLINGDTIESTLRQVVKVLPQAAHINFSPGRFVVIGYDDWKARVKAKQKALQKENER